MAQHNARENTAPTSGNAWFNQTRAEPHRRAQKRAELTHGLFPPRNKDFESRRVFIVKHRFDGIAGPKALRETDGLVMLAPLGAFLTEAFVWTRRCR